MRYVDLRGARADRRLGRNLGWLLVLGLGMAVATANFACAQTAEDERAETLAWLDQYLSQSDLLDPKTLVQIRAAVKQMTPSQLDRWLAQTRQLREYVSSPQWQETRAWLQGFLKVQAIYSDQEIQEFRQKLFNANPDELLAMLQKIQAKHESMVWMHQASQQSRQMAVSARERQIARQDAANNAAQQAAAAARQTPLFGSTGGAAGGRPRDSGYQIPGPLINSRMMAQWTAFMGVW